MELYTIDLDHYVLGRDMIIYKAKSDDVDGAVMIVNNLFQTGKSTFFVPGTFNHDTTKYTNILACYLLGRLYGCDIRPVKNMEIVPGPRTSLMIVLLFMSLLLQDKSMPFIEVD